MAKSLEPAASGALTITATDAQNEFGRVLDSANRERDIVITRHSVPRAVLISFDRYQELLGQGAAPLDALTDEFDALLARMQTPAARAGIERAFGATPAQMGRAARNAAKESRKHGSKQGRKQGKRHGTRRGAGR